MADDDPDRSVLTDDIDDRLPVRDLPPPEKTCPSEEFHSAMAGYARVSRAPFPARRRSLLESVRRADSDAHALEQELREIQRRLGTPAEGLGDLDRATTIGHQLANLMWQALLMQEIASRLTAVPCSPPACGMPEMEPEV